MLLIGLGVWLSDENATGTTRIIAASNISVTDGDTMRLNGERIRLIGFYTPETYRAECDSELQRGNLAKNRLSQLIRNAQTLELVEQPHRDRYGRILGRLILDGRDVASIMTEEGLARKYDGGQRGSWC